MSTKNNCAAGGPAGRDEAMGAGAWWPHNREVLMGRSGEGYRPGDFLAGSPPTHPNGGLFKLANGTTVWPAADMGFLIRRRDPGNAFPPRGAGGAGHPGRRIRRRLGSAYPSDFFWMSYAVIKLGRGGGLYFVAVFVGEGRLLVPSGLRDRARPAHLRCRAFGPWRG